MKISARNFLEGKIKEVRKGATTAHVEIELFRRRVAEHRAIARDRAGESIIHHDRWDGREHSHCRREQRFGDARIPASLNSGEASPPPLPCGFNV